MVNKTRFQYAGRENLEAMLEANNYNSYLVDIVKDRIARTTGERIKVLDFGAGIGTYADLLKSINQPVDCLEIDKEQAAILRKKGYKVFNSINSIDSKYDVIYAFNVFEHISNDLKEMGQLKKLLKRNGLIVVYVPAHKLLYSSMDKLVGHFRRYNLKSLKRLAEGNGLSIEGLRYCDPIGCFVTLLYKIIGNKSGTITAGSVKMYDRYLFPASKFMEIFFKKAFGKNALLIAKRSGD